MERAYKILGKINHWWMPFVAGLIMVIVSLLMVFYPGFAFAGLAVWFGWMLFATGGFNFVFAIKSRKVFTGWLWYLFLGLLEMGLGVALLFQPELAAQALILFLGFWLMYVSIMRIVFSFALKQLGDKNWWWTLLAGIIMWIFSFLIIINPIIGAFSAVYFVAIPLFIAGILAMSFGWNLRKLDKFEIALEIEEE